MKRAALLSLWASGCTFSGGEPFGEIASASLTGSYALSDDRDVAGDPGWQKLDTDYQLTLASATVTVDGVELTAVEEGTSLTFDPAHPPPGYTICHNGHCDREDGALVPYAEVAADLVGAGGENSRVAVALGGGELDLAQATALAPACTDTCLIEPGRIVLARVLTTVLVVEGRVRDGLAEPRFEGERDFVAVLPLVEQDAMASLDSGLDLPIDEDEPPRLALALSFAASASLFDDIDYAAADDGAGAIDLAADEAAAATLRAHFFELELTAAVSREEHE